MDIQLIENSLTPEDYIRLIISVGFTPKPSFQIEMALHNGLYSLTAVVDHVAVGMGRLVGDGVMYWYIQDVVVLPEFQEKGIGKAIVNGLIHYAQTHSLPGTRATIGLFAAKNKEPFYEKLSFSERPNEEGGAGMIKRILN